ncbi:MAG: 50S ribosomal protein L35ae [Promethearchaeota archaeon]
MHVLKGVGPKIAEKLKKAGYDSVEALAKVKPRKLQEKAGIGEKTATSLVSGAKGYLEKSKEKVAEPKKKVEKKPPKKEKREKRKKPEKEKVREKEKKKKRKKKIPRKKKEKVEKEETKVEGIVGEGVMLSYRRGGGRIISNVGLIWVDGISTHRKGAQLIGKRVMLIYPSGTTIRGKVISTHGKGGTLRVRFNKGLVGAAIGSKVRIT